VALNYIQSLYAIEKKAEPVLQQFHEWLSKSGKAVTPKSKVGVTDLEA